VKIHMLGSLPHYAQHVLQVWRHLPDHLRGEMVTGQLSGRARFDLDDIVMVGGYYDIDRARGHRVIYVEHGAGQSYPGDRKTATHPAYHGSDHPGNVIGYISPRPEVAKAWGRPAFAAGSPVCDPYVDVVPRHVAVFAFHWDCHIVPETRSAYMHYADHLELMIGHVRDADLEVVACTHPRDIRMPIVWRNLGVERVPASVALSEATLVIADNTSLAYELCNLDRSAIALNAPWYRRDVHHGLRFWDAPHGLPIDHPDEFLALDIASYVGSREAATFTLRAATAAYGPLIDGHAGERAAQWIVDLVGEYGQST
jgi:hypothetical protein